MTPDPESPATLIPSILEERHPEVEWNTSRRIRRCPGLSPDQKSILWKLSENLLVTRERLNRVKKADTLFCLHCPGVTDDREHLLSCSFSCEMTSCLTLCLTAYVPGITPTDIIHLNINVTESLELPLAWLISNVLSLRQYYVDSYC